MKLHCSTRSFEVYSYNLYANRYRTESLVTVLEQNLPPQIEHENLQNYIVESQPAADNLP